MDKKIIFILLIFISLFSFVFTGLKTVDGKKYIIVATDATWPPMEMVNEKKEIVGFDIDLLTAAAKAGGFTVEFKNTAWDGIFAGLDSGEYDAIISSVTITDERMKTMDFSVPYINAGQVLVVRSDMKNIKKLSDLEGKSAGAQIGTTGAFEIEKNKKISLRTYDELGLAMEDLVNKRIDGIVCDSPTAVNYVLQNTNYKGKLIITTKPFTQEFYGVVVKKGSKEVLDLINSGLNKVLKTKTYTDLEKKWLQ
jgi:polar amino acid transport system substrate-binding protein